MPVRRTCEPLIQGVIKCFITPITCMLFLLQSPSFNTQEEGLSLPLLTVHRSLRPLGAWSGLLPMLLLFLAPVISKSLDLTPVHHAAMMASMPDMAMDEIPGISEDGTPATEISPDVHASRMHHPAPPLMDDSACGYCVLLAQLPLDLNTPPALWSTLQAASVHPLLLFQSLISRFTPRFFHPRAPPP